MSTFSNVPSVESAIVINQTLAANGQQVIYTGPSAPNGYGLISYLKLDISNATGSASLLFNGAVFKTVSGAGVYEFFNLYVGPTTYIELRSDTGTGSTARAIGFGVQFRNGY